MPNRRWTTEDVEYLKENIGHRKISEIAKQLDRTELSVQEKFKRLKLGQTKNLTGRVSTGEIACLFSVERNTVYSWVEKHGLPATRKVTSLKKKYVLIYPEDFWKWADANREKIDFRQLERNSFPPEPDWVEEERQNPSYNPKSYRYWSTKEDEELLRLVAKDQSFVEIAEKLNRSRFSVERRYHRLMTQNMYYKNNECFDE